MKAIPNPQIPTRELWVPVTANEAGVGQTFYGDFPTVHCVNVGQFGYMSFRTPQDFNTIIAGRILIIPLDTQAAADIDIFSDYGSFTEPYNQHSEADQVTTYNMTANQLMHIGIDGILTNQLASDIVGII